MTGRRLHVSHVTTYQYSRPMSDGYTVAVVMPRATPWQTVEFADVTVEPEPDERVEGDDLFGNRVMQLGIHHQHDRLTVRATSDVTVRPTHVDGSGPPWEEVASLVSELRGPEALDVRPFAGGVPLLSDSSEHADLDKVAAPAFTPSRPIVEAARELCRTIHEQFDYDHAFTEVSTPLATVLAARRGVCQDFAHLAISALRMFGLPARYVSGYIETTPPGGIARRRCLTRLVRGVGAPASDGSTSTRRTGTCPPTTTSRWRGDETTATSPRCAASSSARRRRSSSPSPSRSPAGRFTPSHASSRAPSSP